MLILIDKRLEELKKTRYWLANITNVGYGNIKKLCDGDSVQLSVKTLDKICTALNCRIGDILQSEIDIDTNNNIKESSDSIGVYISAEGIPMPKPNLSLINTDYTVKKIINSLIPVIKNIVDDKFKENPEINKEILCANICDLFKQELDKIVENYIKQNGDENIFEDELLEYIKEYMKEIIEED